MSEFERARAMAETAREQAREAYQRGVDSATKRRDTETIAVFRELRFVATQQRAHLLRLYQGYETEGTTAFYDGFLTVLPYTTFKKIAS